MSNWAYNDNVDDFDIEENEKASFTGRDGTIYLIDAAICKSDKDQFLLCLECIEEDLLKSIITNARDLVSVVFYNTDKSPPPSVQLSENEEISLNIPDNCAIFIPLKPLSKGLIQYFKNFRQSDDFFNFDETYGVSKGSCFSDAVWLCSRQIMRCNYRLHHSKIVLFTNNELPHMNGTKEHHDAFVRAQDLLTNRIDVELVPLVDKFNMETFYKQFLSTVQGIEPDLLRCDSPQDQRNKMLFRYHRQNNRKACLRHINFELADSVSLSCDIYSLTRKAKKPNTVTMLRENKEIVVSKRSYFVREPNTQNPDETVQREVLPSQMFKSQVICGKEILFSPEEVRAMKEIQGVGLRLLGFKPLDSLKPRWMIKHCLFLYPNEKKIIGSTTLFRALWEKCLQKKKYALCTLTVRRGVPPKYVVLVPQKIENDGNDGFCMIFLPMETNIGTLESIVNPLDEPTPEQVALVQKLCKKLRFKYAPQKFPNPTLQSFYTHLEATVYDEEPKEILDLTLPDLDRQDKQLAKDDILDQFLLEFGTEDAVSSKRRGTDGESGSTRAKAPKKDLSAADVEEAIRNGREEAVTIQHIKDFIKLHKAHAPPRAVKKTLFEFAQKLID